MEKIIKQSIQKFTDLVAWQKSHQLALLVYKVTSDFPAQEKFSLVDQLRRASVSATSNIAEGFSRNTPKDKAQFYTIAIGSLYEVQSQLLLARDLGYIRVDIFNQITDEIISAIKLTHKLKSSTYQMAEFKPRSSS